MATWTHAGRYGPEGFITTSGAALDNVAVTVYTTGTTTKASLYTDRARSAAAANPTATDSSGDLVFYAEPGLVDLAVAGATAAVTVAVPPDTDDLLTGLNASGTSNPLGVAAVTYDTVHTSWPARPSVGILPAGQAMYTSASSTAANPVDMQLGDLLFIPAAVSAPSFTAASPPAGVVSTAYSYQFAASGTPSSWAVASGTIPAGTTFSTTTGLLSGTPTTNATYTFTISATNAGGTTTTSSIAVVINASSTTFSFDNTAANWTDNNNATAGSSGTQHGGVNSLSLTVGAAVQTLAALGNDQTVVAGSSYSMPAVFVRSSAANRKAFWFVVWLNGATNLGTVNSAASVTLSSGAFVTGPVLVNIVAPTSATRAACQLVVQSTDGSNLPTSEVTLWSFT